MNDVPFDEDNVGWASFSAFEDDSNVCDSSAGNDIVGNKSQGESTKLRSDSTRTDKVSGIVEENEAEKDVLDPLKSWFEPAKTIEADKMSKHSNGNAVRNKARQRTNSEPIGVSNVLPNAFQGRLASASIDVQTAKVKGILGETMQAGVYRMMGQKKKKKLWVLRVTSSKPGAPKPKYLRQLVIDAWEVGALTAFQHHITSRPILTQPVVALKTCIVWLKLLQQGAARNIARKL